MTNFAIARQLLNDYTDAEAARAGVDAETAWAIARHVNQAGPQPAWATHAIIATLEVDACDSQTDYFATRRIQTVTIGWSRHGRDLFSEFRKCAASFEPTRELATAPKSAEHREKYSMGRGYYLKASGCYASGWLVRKQRL